MVKGMAKKYYDKVVKGEMRWTEIKSLWIEDVKAELVATGYTLHEDKKLPDYGTVSKNVPIVAEAEPAEGEGGE